MLSGKTRRPVPGKQLGKCNRYYQLRPLSPRLKELAA